MTYKYCKRILHFVLILFILSCNGQENKKSNANNQSKESSVDNKEELYEGKIFYLGDELNNYEFVNSKELSKKDSLSYSIYKAINKKEFIISLEKFISNKDQEKYKIIKIFRLNNYSPQNTTVKFLSKENQYSIIISHKNTKLNEWNFKQNTKNILNWNGKYNGRFLRLQDEATDPRAWGQINIVVNGKKVQFKLDSYTENIEENLDVIDSTNNQLILKKLNSDKTLTLTKTNDKYILEGNLIDSILQFNDKYNLKKTE